MKETNDFKGHSITTLFIGGNCVRALGRLPVRVLRSFNASITHLTQSHSESPCSLALHRAPRYTRLHCAPRYTQMHTTHVIVALARHLEQVVSFSYLRSLVIKLTLLAECRFLRLATAVLWTNLKFSASQPMS